MNRITYVPSVFVKLKTLSVLCLHRNAAGLVYVWSLGSPSDHDNFFMGDNANFANF